MKVLHVISSLDPAGGGPPMIAARLAAAQLTIGHEVTLAAHTYADRRECVEQSMSTIPRWERVHKIDVPPISVPDILTRRGGNDTLESAVRYHDVVHLHSIWHPIILVASWCCRRHDKPYVILLNGMLDPWCLQQRRLKKKIALLLAYRPMLDHAAALHLGNEQEQRLIAPLGLKAPGAIIPNGVFFEEIDPLSAPGRFHEHCPAVGDRKYFLFMSRLHYKKGLDVLAEAFALYVQAGGTFDLVVAGPDNGDGSLEDFRGRVSGHHLDHRVHLTGPIYGPTKYHALADATAFVLPSRQEGFSVAITEALACGLPCVVTEGCHFPQVAEAGAGIITQLDPEAFGQGLLRIESAPEQTARMRHAARKLVETRFTWERIAERTIETYKRYSWGHL